ncbi:DUF6436 domain-containing protein [Alteromonas sp. CYL-A6]|uniref:DUF6436 domain-containing protein n=1 Tax=Alteromonas nitratireducens TaxID=3390813 RepID=UPI0034BC96C4
MTLRAILLSVWLCAVVLLLWLQQQSVVMAFDPANTLTEQVDAVHDALRPLAGDETITAIHISSSDCPCDDVSKRHRRSVMQTVTRRHGSNVLINDSTPEFSQIARLLPALPAIAIFHGDNLTYLGPYATGANCLPGKGLAEPWLRSRNDLISDYGTLPTVIPSDAMGCYCTTPEV